MIQYVHTFYQLHCCYFCLHKILYRNQPHTSNVSEIETSEHILLEQNIQEVYIMKGGNTLRGNIGGKETKGEQQLLSIVLSTINAPTQATHQDKYSFYWRKIYRKYIS